MDADTSWLGTWLAEETQESQHFGRACNCCFWLLHVKYSKQKPDASSIAVGKRWNVLTAVNTLQSLVGLFSGISTSKDICRRRDTRPAMSAYIVEVTCQMIASSRKD